MTVIPHVRGLPENAKHDGKERKISTESFNDWGGRGCRKFVPVLKGDGTKIAPPRDIFDQPAGELS